MTNVEFDRMQDDAIRRVHEMQSKAQTNIENLNSSFNHYSGVKETSVRQAEQPTAHEEKAVSPGYSPPSYFWEEQTPESEKELSGNSPDTSALRGNHNAALRDFPGDTSSPRESPGTSSAPQNNLPRKNPADSPPPVDGTPTSGNKTSLPCGKTFPRSRLVGSGKGKSGKGVLDSIISDPDVLIILAMLYLLSGSENDELMYLGLLYILL